ncbi:MAG: response regulator transcription factor [Bacteroidales bacterium]|jgi:two-component system invasion response regulator UvrY|nr:response regulator transcription factor [Bacteroidales bacterium]
MNILIVDDNKQFRNALKYILQENLSDKYSELYEAENGDECIDIVKKQAIDVIFMDKEMPIMNGEEATKKIVDNYRNIKIIALSFHSELEDIKSMLEAGARNYIVKEEITSEVIANCL